MNGWQRPRVISRSSNGSRAPGDRPVTTASASTPSSALKSTSRPGCVRQESTRQRFTTWLHCWNVSSRWSQTGKPSERIWLSSRASPCCIGIPANLLIVKRQGTRVAGADLFASPHVRRSDSGAVVPDARREGEAGHRADAGDLVSTRECSTHASARKEHGDDRRTEGGSLPRVRRGVGEWVRRRLGVGHSLEWFGAAVVDTDLLAQDREAPAALVENVGPAARTSMPQVQDRHLPPRVSDRDDLLPTSAMFDRFNPEG